MTAEPSQSPRQAMGAPDVVTQILDLARWAPSGDNTQPWRFELRSPSEIVVHGYDTHANCVYDLDRMASHLAHGMLLETLVIAATRFGQEARLQRIVELPDRVEYAVSLAVRDDRVADPLADFIESRTAQRWPMRRTPLSPAQRASLEQAIAPYTILWFAGTQARLRAAAVNARNARIRMTIPEAHAVHAAVIDFTASTSEDKMPAVSLGAPAPLRAMMRWAMQDWKRMDAVNRYAGTFLPRLLLDFLPGVLCSAHFVVLAPAPLDSVERRVAAGRTLQRFWLTATRLGLQMQPSYTPLLFARFAREGRAFSQTLNAMPRARDIADRLDRLIGDVTGTPIWFGRLGPARPTRGRSLRLPLDRLLVDASDGHSIPSSSSGA